MVEHFGSSTLLTCSTFNSTWALIGHGGQQVRRVVTSWVVVVWTIWRSRNALKFKGEALNVERTCGEIKGRVWS